MASNYDKVVSDVAEAILRGEDIGFWGDVVKAVLKKLTIDIKEIEDEVST